ncbi:MAG: CoA transferase [Halioglobus sp.]
MDSKLYDGLLVIDCASFIAGPAAATIFADFGARVIKIEPPHEGDGYRKLIQMPGIPRSESNYPWSLTNRSKESLAVDLKHPQGRKILEELVKRADVFITNYPTPVRDKLKLRYTDLKPLNSRLIYGSLTPYGETGPESAKTGYDATAWWARSGLMEQVRASADTPPAISVPGMGDHMAANTLYGAIASALYRRERTGQGAMVGTSLLANGLWSNGIMVQAALEGANMSARMDQSKVSAFTRSYRCRDDRWFLLTILPQAQDKSWPSLTQCIGQETLENDPRFSTMADREKNKTELADILGKAFEEKDWADWERDFAAFSITCGVIAKTQDATTDEQVRGANMLVTDNSPEQKPSLDSPIYFEGVEKRPPQQAPSVGEHSKTILAELGFSGSELSQLEQDGVIS